VREVGDGLAVGGWQQPQGSKKVPVTFCGWLKIPCLSLAGRQLRYAQFKLLKTSDCHRCAASP